MVAAVKAWQSSSREDSQHLVMYVGCRRQTASHCKDFSNTPNIYFSFIETRGLCMNILGCNSFVKVLKKRCIKSHSRLESAANCMLFSYPSWFTRIIPAVVAAAGQTTVMSVCYQTAVYLSNMLSVQVCFFWRRLCNFVEGFDMRRWISEATDNEVSWWGCPALSCCG